jgi:KipI family sensor histidine kinase inhibitor
VIPFGETAILAVLDDQVSAGAARRARRLAEAVAALRSEDPRWGTPVPAAASVLAPFDPLALDPPLALDSIRNLVARLPAVVPPDPGARLVEVSVRYGGEDGPDLEIVAAETGRTPADVVSLHAGTEFEVAFLGFAPGFPYLVEVPDELVVPRLATPRIRVPAGSVGIAGRVSGIYPGASPGGWRLLGRTSLGLFDPAADPPALLRPGDRVRFVPVDGP